MVEYQKFVERIGLEGRRSLSKLNWRLRSIAMGSDDDNDNSLTADQRARRKLDREAKIALDEASVEQTEKWLEARKSNPEKIQLRCWIKEIFKGDIDAICDFTAQLMLDQKASDEEHDEVRDRLQNFLQTSYRLTEGSNISPQIRQAYAEYILETRPDDPASRTFLGGAQVSRVSQATRGGNTRAKNRQPVKDFAIKMFDARKWASVKQAKTTLWPQVREEAKRHGWTMSEETGPETVYKWLLAHKKS